MRAYYALHPGWVLSKNDGQRHFVGPNRLARLYHLEPDEYIIWNPIDNNNYDDYIHLTPRFDGNYQKPAIPIELVIPNDPERKIVEGIIERMTRRLIGDKSGYVRRERPRRKDRK